MGDPLKGHFGIILVHLGWGTVHSTESTKEWTPGCQSSAGKARQKCKSRSKIGTHCFSNHYKVFQVGLTRLPVVFPPLSLHAFSLIPPAPSFAVSFFARPLSPRSSLHVRSLFLLRPRSQPRSRPSFLPASHALIVLVKRKSPMDERTRGRSRPRRRPCLSRPLVPQKENPQRMIQVSIKFQH